MQKTESHLIAKYKSDIEFIEKFNPEYQMQICGNEQVCFFGDYPTLGKLKVFGEYTSTAWLVPQLTDLSEYCGVKEKLQGRPLEETAFVIATEYFYLKISEIMLFFHRFKTGRYGRFYGNVDPLIITSSLREFCNERIAAYEKRDQEERERKEAESRSKAVTWEQYCLSRYGEVREHPFSHFQKPEPPKPKPADILKEAKKVIAALGDLNESLKNSFISIFKKKYGTTPQEYVKTYESKHNL